LLFSDGENIGQIAPAKEASFILYCINYYQWNDLWVCC
jgi:hypothetical protein